MKKPGQIVLFKFPQGNLVEGKLRPATDWTTDDRLWTTKMSSVVSCPSSIKSSSLTEHDSIMVLMKLAMKLFIFRL